MSGQMESALAGVSHADRMDRMYRYQRHIYDITRKYYLLGRDRMIAGLHVPQAGSLLEIGCGTGRNLLIARRTYPSARLYGLDISAEMLASARRNFESAGSTPTFAVADATTFTPQDLGASGFDRIMISYALSMIPDWERSIDAALSALNPSGSLHVVDFGQQERLPAWSGALLKAWLARFHVTPRAALEAELAAKARAAGMHLTFEKPYRGYAWHAVVARNP
ncbi:class I SAM-dependent methyltransferase [Rhizobiaceae bacterium n13]|uniref:Class I SAM-dependent methyltransferase n=1 Tax=Ferirhizobium litorale TaxID=2927786 RepID=A0AAE3U5J9_9HYPH|nr:class I SAM-dependent methyltransferase [Fererhizobium litorale]MDI7863766.1 class I SAM-dependent methyltransferase [Fererhizobium litorale]MDI7924134.1 class I SAM-dependent methyltransferase [Fererhizobium litorale]